MAEAVRLELYVEVFPVLPDCEAYGGRLPASSDCRLVLIPFMARVGLVVATECATVVLLPRLAKLELFMVRYAECEAAAAGAVRATTLRFSMLRDGVATLCMFAAPSALARVGVALIWFVTWAPRKDASVKCCALRLTRSPFTNVLRDAVVTACVLWAYT